MIIVGCRRGEMLLGEIARIKAGLVLSRKKAEIEFDIKARYKLLTLKNIDDDGTFNEHLFEEFQCNDVLSEHYFTNEGDILIRLNHPNTSVYITNEQKGLLVPSYFAIVKLLDDRYLPSYIAWYLNTEQVKIELMKSQSGTQMPSTNKSVLGKIDIPYLSLAKQKKLTDIHQLYKKEKMLYRQLLEKKEQLYLMATKQLLKTN